MLNLAAYLAALDHEESAPRAQALVAKMNELRRESENHAPNSKLLSEKEEDTQSAEKAPPAVVEAIEIKN